MRLARTACLLGVLLSAEAVAQPPGSLSPVPDAAPTAPVAPTPALDPTALSALGASLTAYNEAWGLGLLTDGAAEAVSVRDAGGYAAVDVPGAVITRGAFAVAVGSQRLNLAPAGPDLWQGRVAVPDLRMRVGPLDADVTYRGQQIEIAYDTRLGLPTRLAGTIDSVATVSTLPSGPPQRSLLNGVTFGVEIRPAADGTLDVTTDLDIAEQRQDFGLGSELGVAELGQQTSRYRSTGIRIDALRPLVQEVMAALDALPAAAFAGTDPGPDDAQALAATLLTAVTGALSRPAPMASLESEDVYRDLRIAAPIFTLSIARIESAGAVSGLRAPTLEGRMRVAVGGISAPSVPAEAAGYVPTEVTLSVAMAGLPRAALADALLASIDQSRAMLEGVPPGLLSAPAFGQVLAGARFELPELSYVARDLRVTGQGTVTIDAASSLGVVAEGRAIVTGTAPVTPGALSGATGALPLPVRFALTTEVSGQVTLDEAGREQVELVLTLGPDGRVLVNGVAVGPE